MTRTEGRLLYEIIVEDIYKIHVDSQVLEHDGFDDFIEEVKRILHRELCPRITDKQAHAIINVVKSAYQEEEE